VVTSFSDGDGTVVVVVASTSFLLSTVVVIIDEDEVEDDELDVSSSDGNGKLIDTLEPFEPIDDVPLSSLFSSSSSSSSPKGDSPNTLVPLLVLSTPGLLLLPPKRLRRTIGPRARMTSAIIELTFASIL
jgi:hypothetical protein